MINLDSETPNTWRSAARATLQELERKSEAVYNEEPERHLVSLTDFFVLIAGQPKNKILHELETLSLYAVRALINRDEWDKDQLSLLLTQKQHDYGVGNILAFGIDGILVRMSDKVARLKNLQGKNARNESLIDTLTDIVGYAVVATMLDNETFFIKELGLGIDDELV